MVLQQTLLRINLRFSLFIVAFFLTCTAAFSQSYLEVPVKLDVEKGSMDGVLVKVKKDGKDAFTQSGSSKMRFKLDYNKRYTLVFTKDGYVTKTIEFDTHAPAARIKDGFEPYTIGVKLFAQDDEKHTVVYNQAVGIIKYDNALDEFGYDTDYSKSILSGVEETEEKTDSLVAEKPEEPPVAQAKEEKKSKPKEKPSRKKKKDEEPVTQDEPVAVVDNPEKKSGGKTPGSEPPPRGKGSLASEAPPKGLGSGGNDTSPRPSGNGGNDNSNLIAMADGGDPGSGLIASTGDEMPPISSGSTGSEKPSVVLSPSSGAESGSGKMAPAAGAETQSLGEMFDSQNITREDIVEDKRIVTIVRVTKRNTTTEYRRVKYRWGGPYYFIDNKLSISETVFAFYTGVKD